LLAPGDALPIAEFTKDSLGVVLKNIAEKKAVLVDVRSVEEWNQGHIEGAIFLPIDSLRKYSLAPQKLHKTLPKGKILYTYCLVGMRAKAAATILEKQGHSVRALKPGYEDLLNWGFRKASVSTAQR
jgi:rhodanese-related sulfurtransferase